MNQEKIFFITDSACDIPAEDEKRLPNLAILPIPVTADGKGYYERESFTAEEFYDLIDRCQDIPATSHIPAITFQEKYEEAYQNGYTHVAVITIYSGASAMYHSALMAKDAFLEEHPDAMQIEVIDSNCYSVGYGYPIMQACQRALEGESFEDVLAYIRDYLRRVRIYFSPFTLKYVKKSGRVSCAAAFVGELIGLRPVISAVGTTSIVEKVRGNAAILSTMERLFKEQRSARDRKAPYMILVARDTETSEQLAKASEKIAGYPPVGTFKIRPSPSIPDRRSSASPSWQTRLAEQKGSGDFAVSGSFDFGGRWLPWRLHRGGAGLLYGKTGDVRQHLRHFRRSVQRPELPFAGQGTLCRNRQALLQRPPLCGDAPAADQRLDLQLAVFLL